MNFVTKWFKEIEELKGSVKSLKEEVWHTKPMRDEVMEAIRLAYHCDDIASARPILSLVYEKHRSKGMMEEMFTSFMMNGEPHIHEGITIPARQRAKVEEKQ